MDATNEYYYEDEDENLSRLMLGFDMDESDADEELLRSMM